jgi:hypothetical protein
LPDDGDVPVVLIPCDCSAYSDWQSVIVVRSLQHVRRQFGQKFRIRRLISCNEPERLVPLFRSLGADADEDMDVNPVTVALGDPYPHPPMRGFVYPPLNKPHAVSEWLASDAAAGLSNATEIFIVDPDFLFLDRLPLGASRMGEPAASGTYSIGANWYLAPDSPVRHFCRGECGHPTAVDILERFDIGAPYAIRLGDLRRLTPYWLNMTEEMVLAADLATAWSTPGGWLCEMYAFSMAAMRTNLPHTRHHDWMVYVPGHLTSVPAAVATPVALHFCQQYDFSHVTDAYSAKFNKHDFHDRGERIVLSCDETTVVNSVFRRHGWKVPDIFQKVGRPWINGSTAWPGPMPSLPPPQSRDVEASFLREQWFLYSIYYHFSLILGEFREQACEDGRVDVTRRIFTDI